MTWYNFWRKKPVEKAVKATPVVPKDAGLLVIDYPKSKYTVYWEIHLFEQPEGDWVAEVRFIGYNGHDHRTYHSVAAPTKAQAQVLAEKLIIEKMPDYKR